jgi:hypothetical protein
MHLKLTAGCQISILIFEKKLWRRGLYKYPMKNISRTAKHPAVSFRCIIPPRHLSQLKTRAIPLTWPRWARILSSLIYFLWDIYRDPPSKIFFQISELIFDTLLWA